MARPTKASNMTKAERRTAISDLRAQLKSATATLKEYERAVADAQKTAQKAAQANGKAVESARAKFAKAQAAHEKGTEKIQRRIDELESITE